MRINMILFTITIQPNKLSRGEYIEMKAAKNDMLDCKANSFTRLF